MRERQRDIAQCNSWREEERDSLERERERGVAQVHSVTLRERAIEIRYERDRERQLTTE